MKTIADYVYHDVEHFDSSIDSHNVRDRYTDDALLTYKRIMNFYNNDVKQEQVFKIKGFTVNYACVELHVNVVTAVAYYISYWENKNSTISRHLRNSQQRVVDNAYNYFKNDIMPDALLRNRDQIQRKSLHERLSDFNDLVFGGIHLDSKSMYDYVLGSTTMFLTILEDYHSSFEDTKELPHGNLVREVLLPLYEKYNQKAQGKTIDVFL